jgi:hypothetical protein
LCAQLVRGPFARFEVFRCRAVLAQAQGRFSDARHLEAEAFAVLAPTGHSLPYVLRSGLLPLIGRHAGQDVASLAANSFAGAEDGTVASIGLIAQVACAHTFVSAGELDDASRIHHSLGPVSSWQPPPHVVLSYTH